MSWTTTKSRPARAMGSTQLMDLSWHYNAPSLAHLESRQFFVIAALDANSPVGEVLSGLHNHGITGQYHSGDIPCITVQLNNDGQFGNWKALHRLARKEGRMGDLWWQEVQSLVATLDPSQACTRNPHDPNARHDGKMFYDAENERYVVPQAMLRQYGSLRLRIRELEQQGVETQRVNYVHGEHKPLLYLTVPPGTPKRMKLMNAIGESLEKFDTQQKTFCR